MLARVKQDYTAGAVIAFSGHEYIRSEWREVPAGFEEQAKNHQLLEVQPSLDEIRAHGPKPPSLPPVPAVTVVTEEPLPAAEPEPPAEEVPAAEDPTSKTSRRRKRPAGE